MSSLHHLLPIIFLIITINHSFGYLLKVTKDAKTHQYTTDLLIGSPQLQAKLVVHLSGESIWLTCPPSSRKLIEHGSITSLVTKVQDSKYHQNPVTGFGGTGYLAEESVFSSAGDGSTFKIPVTCSEEYLLQGLVTGARGVLGFGRSKAAFQSRTISSFDLPRRFSICLSKSEGFIVSGPHVSNSLSYTPLVTNGVNGKGYYMSVNSMKVNGRKLAIGHSIGGVEISTIVPYTTMESTIYEIFTRAYVTSAKKMNMTIVDPVAPFGTCFRSQAKVPDIELVLQSVLVKWKIQRRNVMVDVSDSVMCLGFVDGGLGMDSLMVLGGYQLEDHVLEFNMGTNMMGFSTSLLNEGSSCSKLMEAISTPKESL
ncbi:aspartic peptidase A1 family [Artemisia annua]|uniref:Aspartic peptidase A1 family n=1 Tax=Artemisia annua TaxID=35608 RepID=A0A2U1ML49_ARTAN|nr:aspartic peptidase A1 family [Artemisia annua]